MKKNCAILFAIVAIFLWGATIANAKSLGIVVKKGDSMWKISQVQGVSFIEVVKLNKKRFKNVDLIHEGDIVLIPEAADVSSQKADKEIISGADGSIVKNISAQEISARDALFNRDRSKKHFSELETKILKTLGFIFLVVVTFLVVRRILAHFCWKLRKNSPISEEIFEVTRGYNENDGQNFSVESGEHESIFSSEKEIANKHGTDISLRAREKNPDSTIPFVNRVKNKLKKKKSEGFIAISKETEKFTFVGLNIHAERNVSGWCACSDLAGLAKYIVFARGKVTVDENIFEIPKYLEDRFYPLNDLYQKELRKLMAEFGSRNIGAPLSVVWKSISNE